jgi:energy-coupling factor transporter ATP-binding protein EcfA2
MSLARGGGMTPTEKKDFFISYRTLNEGWAEWIAWHLEAEGYTTFLQAWDFRPGRNFVNEMEHGITCCARTLAVLSPAYFESGFTKAEWFAAFAQDPTGEKGLLLPVRVEPCDVEGLLGQIIYVNLVGLDEQAARERLLAGIAQTRAKPTKPPRYPGAGGSAEGLKPSLPALQQNNPYRGLAPFRGPHRAFFKGRERYIEQVRAKLNEKRLVAIIGASGSGKSSLALAGILPALEEEGWRTAEFRPQRDPFQNLALGLVQHLQPSLSDAGPIYDAAMNYAKEFRDDPSRLYERCSFLIERSGSRGLLILADQFEELFSQSSQSDLVAFVELMFVVWRNAHAPIKWLVTLRADFMERALQGNALTQMLQDADVKLGPMNEDELRTAIVEPAQTLGVRFADGLPERLVRDAITRQTSPEHETGGGGLAGRLPLLEFALAELWMRQRGGMIGHEAYDDPDAGIGGIEGALRQHAERVYSHLDEATKSRAQRLFRRLVARGPGLNDVRRIVPRAEVEEDWNDLVMELAKHRLVTTSEPVPREATVEIIHEELLRAWPALRQWISENREFDLWRQGLTEQADRWQAAPETEKLDILLRATQLDKALVYLRERDQDLTPKERGFIRLSVALRKQQRKREERARRWKIQLAMGIAVVFLVLFGIAERYRELAEEEAAVAKHQTALATSRGLAAEARNYLNKQLDLALLLSVEAHRKAKTAEARQVLYTALDAAGSSLFLHGYWDRLWRLVFSPDGRTLAAGGTLGTLLLWDLGVSPPARQALPGHLHSVGALALSSNGQWLASGDGSGTVLRWDLSKSPPDSISLSGHQGGIRRLALSPDGKILASGDDKGTLFLWDLSGTRPQRISLPGHQGIIERLTFSPDGTTLASSDSNGAFLLWELSTTPPVEAFRSGYRHGVSQFTFSPDGKTLASVDYDGPLLIWNLSATGPVRTSPRGHHGGVKEFIFRPDGNRLAVGAAGNRPLLWDLRVTPPHSTLLAGHRVGHGGARAQPRRHALGDK